MQTIIDGSGSDFDLAVIPTVDDSETRPTITNLVRDRPLKWSWSCRAIPEHAGHTLLREVAGAPCVGDVGVARVVAVGHHTRVMTAGFGKQRLYPDDITVGVFGNRYATDAFEGEVAGTDDLHMLTDAGMIGTVRSRHSATKRPTQLEFLGFLADDITNSPLFMREFKALSLIHVECSSGDRDDLASGVARHYGVA